MPTPNTDTPIFTNQQLVTALNSIAAAIVANSLAIAACTTAVQLLRWGIPREPVWVGGLTTTPAGGATLATQTVTAAKTGRVFGVVISSAFADNFTLNDNANILEEFQIGINGQAVIIAPLPLNDGLVATHVITIKCVAGGTGIVLAKFLYDEA